MSRLTGTRVIVGVLVALASFSIAVVAAPPKPPAEPAKIDLAVSPESTAPGGSTEVTLNLRPAAGIRINRYPQIKLAVPAAEGLVKEAAAAVGNKKPPPVDEMETNYFDKVEPLTLTLETEPDAKPGRHEIEGKLVYFYCVKKSGFCAPARVNVKIPVEIR